MPPIRDEVCRVRGLRACVARLPSTFAGRLPFTMVACSAAQRSETAYLRVPVQRHDGWRLIPEVTDRHHRGQGRVTARSCQVAVDALEEVRAVVLQDDVGPGDQVPHGPGDPPSSMLVGRLPAVPFQAVFRRAGWR